jgi:hypothetical protein
MSSSGLQHMLAQQSTELARLHQRLKEKQIPKERAYSNSIKKRVVALE